MKPWMPTRIYAGLCGALAVAGSWFSLDDLRTWHAAAIWSALPLLAVSALLIVTAVSCLCEWRFARRLAAVTGLALIVYAFAVVFVGWEDVGGAGAVPVALGTGATGGLGLVVATCRRAKNRNGYHVGTG